MSEIAATFRKPFVEQVAAWRLRLGNLVPTSKWDDLRGRQYERGFMVAGAFKVDLMEDLAVAIDRAIVDGTGLEAFKKEFRALVERNGWHGWTGEGTKRGEEWRMRTIYRTNMRTTYMAGRHAQLVDRNYKYWVYRHSGARHPRLDHMALDGIALPPDHPFWLRFYPPNGWGCGCEVEGANTRKGIIRMGGDPDKQLPPDWDAIDPRTGEPFGIGKGWGYPIGAEVREDVLAMVGKLRDWPETLAREFLRSLPARLKLDVAKAMEEMRGFSDALLKEGASNMSDAIFADEALQAGIQAAIKDIDDPSDLFNEIGAALVRSTKDRIIEGVSPDGTPFAARSQTTLDRYLAKGIGNISTLRQSGDMGADIFHSYDNEQTEVGSNAVQAAMMQFGGTKASFPNLWGDIPARPFLGFSDQDEIDIADIVEEWLLTIG